ncbi:diguanylate cyclase [Salmonella enterica subsp. salamae]|nr:EAL domain-containing protein [Salmonella enterica subsp. salamae]ECI4078466.1 diguanylate cyclase [Salmonella enterica subsp. salamae]EEO2383166.1 EAL domain-containing protein [Salmonella enterica]
MNPLHPTSSPTRHSYLSSGLLKFEPIVHLSTAQLIGYEVLTQLPSGHDSEVFFQQLSQQALHNHFFHQIDALRFCPQNIRYFLNLPMKLLLKLRSYSSNLTIELQDPGAFYTLRSGQQFRLYERIQRLETSGLPVWLDDIDEKMLATFSNENWRLSGVKFDKKTFWNLVSEPQKMRQAILIGYKIAADVLMEGIETSEQRSIAFYAGATMGQGYLWPAMLPDIY